MVKNFWIVSGLREKGGLWRARICWKTPLETWILLPFWRMMGLARIENKNYSVAFWHPVDFCLQVLWMESLKRAGLKAMEQRSCGHGQRWKCSVFSYPFKEDLRDLSLEGDPKIWGRFPDFCLQTSWPWKKRTEKERRINGTACFVLRAVILNLKMILNLNSQNRPASMFASQHDGEYWNPPA